MAKVGKKDICFNKVKNRSKKLNKTKNPEDSSGHAETSQYFENKTKSNNYKEKDIEDIGDLIQSWKPENWEKTLKNIKEMRKSRDAPVDKMGCDKCMDLSSKPETIRYQALVSLMLSSQTKDEVTFAAMERLKNYKTGLQVDSILKMPEETLGKLIYPVGFWRRKAKYIKESTEIIKNKFQGDIPNSVELLCQLPGVGPKMAHICMKSAWGIVSGVGDIFSFFFSNYLTSEMLKFFVLLGVDTHVHRICNRIGWLNKPTKTPEQTRIILESWIPKHLWEEINHLLVGFGQQICKPVKPLCETCKNMDNCPFPKQTIMAPKKKKSF